MSAGTGKIRKVAAFRGAPPGKAGLPPVEADPDSIDMDLVNGVPRFDTVGGIDKTYTKPPSSFFSGGLRFYVSCALAHPCTQIGSRLAEGLYVDLG